MGFVGCHRRLTLSICRAGYLIRTSLHRSNRPSLGRRYRSWNCGDQQVCKMRPVPVSPALVLGEGSKWSRLWRFVRLI